MDEDRTYVHLSQELGIESPEEKLDFLDANLGFDNRFYIDPFLLKNSHIPEESALFNRFEIFFQQAYKMAISVDDKLSSDELRHFLTFPEPKEINLGYSYNSNRGHGPGPKFSRMLFNFFLTDSAAKLVKEGWIYEDEKFDPDTFRVFIDRFGPDGISDITANLIMDYLIVYTQQQCDAHGLDVKSLPLNQLGLTTTTSGLIEWKGSGHADLPENPFKKGQALIFVPKRLLRSLDGETDRLTSTVVGILREDKKLTEKFSIYLSKNIDKITDDETRTVLLEDKSILKRYLSILHSANNQSYDFLEDPYQLMAIKKYYDLFSRDVSATNEDPLINHLEIIIQRFTRLMTEMDGWRYMWKDKKFTIPQLEDAFGRDFFSIAFGYTSRISDIRILPETGTKRGFVDFYIHKGNEIATIELKRLVSTTNTGDPPLPAYIHGIERQLPIYIKNTESNYGIYITAQHWTESNAGTANDNKKIEAISNKIPEIESGLKKLLPNFSKLLHFNVDVSPKKPASKY